MSWPKIRKIIILKCHLLLFCTTTANHFSFQLWHATKADFIQQLEMTSSVVGLSKSFRAKFAPKGSHGHCLVVYYQSYPLQLSQSQWNHYIWSMLGKSMRCIKNWNACSWHWSREWAQFSMTTSNRKLHNQCFKNWMNCATVLPCSSAIVTWPLANLLSLFQGCRQLFAEKMLPQQAEGRKCFF